MKKNQVLAIGLTALGGIAVGAALGILFAPAKGEITRRKISRTAEHTIDSMKDKVEDLKDSVQELVGKETAMVRKAVRGMR